MDQEEPLFEVDPQRDVEWQVDAMFEPLYALIPRRHHALIGSIERHMVHAIKVAMRGPARQPVAVDPRTWPAGTEERLEWFLSRAQKNELREARDKRR